MSQLAPPPPDSAKNPDASTPSPSPAADPIIGIDLGTTNSLVAYCDERGPRVLSSPDGRRHLPSVVHIDPVTGRWTVGQEALAHAVERPTETIYSAKRLMGRGLADIAGEIPFLPYKVVAHATGSMAEIEVGGVRYTPQQIGAAVLGELKRWAEAALGRGVRRAVVTVPAYFDDAQRQATRDAGAIVGLEIVRIVNEPTAAALAYGLDKQASGTIAVYDLGGGTFDVSVLKIDNGLFRVLSTNGDTHLGGDDFDRALIRLFQDEISAQVGKALTFPPATQQAMRTLAESIKTRLSSESQAQVEIDLGGSTYRRTVTRDEFLALIEPLVTRSVERCALAIKDAGNGGGKPEIERVVMVGGSTYIPYVREKVGAFFGLEAYTALNPMEVVALGAAVQGAIVAKINRDLLLQDIIPLSLGIETMGGAVAKLVSKGKTIPCVAEEQFSTYTDGQTNVKIHVLQGERELVADCRSLGEFVLGGVPPMPAGIPKIKVRFLVDASGILTVSAIEERSGTKASIQVVPSYGLTREEVSQMTRDSITYARQDMLAHRMIDLKNQIAVDSAAIEKALRLVGGEIDPSYEAQVRGDMRRVQQLAETSTDADTIQLALHELGHLSAHLAEQAVSKALRGT